MTPLYLKKIALSDIVQCEHAITLEVTEAEFKGRFGEAHLGHPDNWDAPGPVELWCYELPWGLQVIFERSLAYAYVNIYMSIMEVDAVLDFLDLRSCQFTVHTPLLEMLKPDHPHFFEGLGQYDLIRLDDNNNRVVMKTYESQRVGNYYRNVFESRGHKQTYSVETRT